MQFSATGHSRFAAQPRSGRLLGGAAAAVTLIASLALLRHGGIGPATGEAKLDALSAALAACAALPLVVWRKAPLAVFVASAAVSALAAALGYAVGIPLGPTAALYLLAASRSEARPWNGGLTAVVVVALAVDVAARTGADGAFPASELLHTGLGWAVAWFAGERTRLLHEHLADLADRAARSERDAAHERELAAAEERARIARDLHDSAGHAVNVIAVRAGAARLRHDEDADRSRAALEDIEEIARQTAAEIDQIVGSLRRPDGSTGVEAPPGLASIDTLVARSVSAGLDVTVDRSGAPRRLPTPVDQAAYRILQEALTNAARHGAGGVRVALTFGESALELSISNPVVGAADMPMRGGHGIAGMQERASLLGGGLETSRVNGDFRVSALLPYAASRR